MSANLHHYASNQDQYISILGSGDAPKRPSIQDGADLPSTYERFERQLAWVLISILLLLYLLTSYVYWAKIECAWPIFS